MSFNRIHRNLRLLTQIVVVILLVFNSNNRLIGQSKEIDSLNNIINSSLIDSNDLLKTHYELAQLYIRNNNKKAKEHFDLALEYYDKGIYANNEIDNYDIMYYQTIVAGYLEDSDLMLTILKRMENDIDKSTDKNKAKFKYLIRQAAYYRSSKTPSKALGYLKKALDVALDDKRNEHLAIVYNHLAIFYRANSDRLDSMSYYLIQSSKYITEEDENKIINYANIGMINFILKNDKIAIEYFTKALEIESDFVKIHVTSALNISKIYLSQDSISKAEIYAEKAMEIGNEIKNENIYSLARVQLGKIKQIQQKTDEAYSNYKMAFDTLKKYNHTSDMHHTAIYISNLFYDKDLNKARIYYEIGKQHQDIDLTSRTASDRIKLFSSLAFKFGDYETAFKVVKQQLEHIEDSYEKNLKLNGRKIQEKNELELENLEKELEIQALKSENRRLLILYSILGLGFLLLLKVISMVTRFFKKKKHSIELEKKSRIQLQKKKELESKNEELEEFAFVSSQGLKNPLMSIIGFSEILKEESAKANNETLRSYTEFIHSSGTRMKNLIDSVLEFSKLSEKSSLENTEVFELNEVINEVKADLIRNNLSQTERIVYKGDSLKIHANKSAFSSVVQNIISNGLKYNESNIPTVIIETLKEKEKVVISFKDNGIGIFEKNIPEIFKMFNRLHNQKKYSGTGLGLSMVKKVINDLNGKIEVKSKKNNGTCFIVTLPKTILAS